MNPHGDMSGMFDLPIIVIIGAAVVLYALAALGLWRVL